MPIIQVALVTGGSSGIGFEIARQLGKTLKTRLLKQSGFSHRAALRRLWHLPRRTSTLPERSCGKTICDRLLHAPPRRRMVWGAFLGLSSFPPSFHTLRPPRRQSRYIRQAARRFGRGRGILERGGHFRRRATGAVMMIPNCVTLRMRARLSANVSPATQLDPRSPLTAPNIFHMHLVFTGTERRNLKCGYSATAIPQRPKGHMKSMSQLASVAVSDESCGVLPQGDVRSAASCEGWISSLEQRWGPGLDILVNCAAGNFLATAEELSPNGFKTGAQLRLLQP